MQAEPDNIRVQLRRGEYIAPSILKSENTPFLCFIYAAMRPRSRNHAQFCLKLACTDVLAAPTDARDCDCDTLHQRSYDCISSKTESLSYSDPLHQNAISPHVASRRNLLSTTEITCNLFYAPAYGRLRETTLRAP